MEQQVNQAIPVDIFPMASAVDFDSPSGAEYDARSIDLSGIEGGIAEDCHRYQPVPQPDDVRRISRQDINRHWNRLVLVCADVCDCLSIAVSFGRSGIAVHVG